MTSPASIIARPPAEFYIAPLVASSDAIAVAAASSSRYVCTNWSFSGVCIAASVVPWFAELAARAWMRAATMIAVAWKISAFIALSSVIGCSDASMKQVQANFFDGSLRHLRAQDLTLNAPTLFDFEEAAA
jgi:hypothetical protein